jgi:ABC-type sugar transport system permease subunit
VTSGTASGAGRTARARRRRGDGLAPYLYVAPALALIGLVFAYPLVTVFGYARQQVGSGLIPSVDVGLDNFRYVRDDPLFRQALGHNGLLFLCVPVLVVLAVLLAALVHERLPGWRVHRFLLFLPYVLAIPVVGVIFSYVFELNGGLNQALRAVGLDGLARDWIGSPDNALWAIGAVIVWKELGFGVLLFLARLSTAPQDLFDAARVDGAGFGATLRAVTLPHLRPAIEFFAVVELINMLSWVFAYVYVMTAGGPQNATVVAEWYIYQNAFANNLIGVAAAAAVLLLGPVLVLIGLRIWVARAEGDGGYAL